MLIKDISKPENYIYAERYVNRYKRTVVNKTSERYQPKTGESQFILPYIELPLTDVKLLLSKPKKEIYKKIISKDKVKFFVHPDMINELDWVKNNSLILDKFVQPTASTRTLLVKNQEFFIKLHLNKRISSYIRRLRENSVAHSILISSEIEKNLTTCPKTFGYLPESIGVSYKDVGMIIREKTPRPKIKEKRNLVPLFSIYSKDIRNKDHKPLFVQIVKQKNADPLDFFIERIVRPLFINMSFFINNYGILLECHGQNVLVEIDRDLEITRLIHRDFQSIYLDKELRKKNGLKTNFKKHIMGEECPKEVSYSLVYDQYLGKHVLDKFVNLLNREFGIPKASIIIEIRKLFEQYFDRSLFPENYYYLYKKVKFVDNNTKFERYNRKPKYRR